MVCICGSRAVWQAAGATVGALGSCGRGMLASIAAGAASLLRVLMFVNGKALKVNVGVYIPSCWDHRQSWVVGVHQAGW